MSGGLFRPISFVAHPQIHLPLRWTLDAQISGGIRHRGDAGQRHDASRRSLASDGGHAFPLKNES